MFSSKPKAQNRIDSLIGAGTRIEGNVIFAGGLRVDGEIKGDVRTGEGEAGTLTRAVRRLLYTPLLLRFLGHMILAVAVKR